MPRLSRRFILHYWATRFVSTGISILVLTLQSVTDLIYFIVIWALSVDSPRLPVFLFVLAIVTFVLLILKQIHLAFRLEWVFGTIRLRERKIGKVTVESFGIPGPEAVRMRTATPAETRSFDLDRRFPWALKVLVSDEAVAAGSCHAKQCSAVDLRSHLHHLPLFSSCSCDCVCAKVRRRDARLWWSNRREPNASDGPTHLRLISELGLVYKSDQSGELISLDLV